MTTNEQQPTAAGRFHDAMMTVMAEYEHAEAAARNAVTSSTLTTLARDYAATNDSAEHRAQLAADVAEGISLAEAGTIRRAAKAVELGMPGIICRARANGTEPNEIARQLGATGSYVRRILRDNPTLLAEARQAHTERSVFWTIQRWEGDHWHELAAQSTTTTTPPNAFARDRLAAARKTETGTAPLRCRVWTFGESEGEPLAEATD
ncbi:hypothetical protein ACFWXZ_14420 [[Kitasatospora] papulosa]|uniref:hypothetical protein n=1 Tax=[Kitasatospora] papulosa TaxID=1464011 RepID=UPI0036C3EDCB